MNPVFEWGPLTMQVVGSLALKFWDVAYLFPHVGEYFI